MSNDRKNFKRVTKRAFETAIIAEHGNDGLGASPYDESTVVDGEYVMAHMTLYYKNDVHVGTWQTGSGWFAVKIAA